jgi:hypothetical protein
MPADIAMTVAAIVLAFLVFAGALAWGDYRTRGMSGRQAGEQRY